MRWRTSAEAAAAFAQTRAGKKAARTYRRTDQRRQQRTRQQWTEPVRIVAKAYGDAQTDRIKLDMARCTVAEILDCVVARVIACQERGKPIPHITNIALRMLHEALGVPLA